MSLRALSADAMLSISGAWTTSEGALAIIARHPSLAALRPKIEEAHRALVEAASQSRARSLDALSAESDRVDAYHDRKLRGVVHVLEALADLTEDADEARELVGLSQRLFPRGVRGQELAYNEEGAQAEESASKLDEATRARLSRIATPWGTLLDDVEAWVAAGRELARLDAERREASREASTSEARATLARARHRWAQAAEAFAAAATADDALSGEETDSLVGALYKAELAALRRE